MNPIGKIPTVIKADGREEPFDKQKLVESLVRSGASEELANDVADHVSAELVGGITTNDIYRHAFLVLKKKQRPIAANYSLKRALTAFGPTGYPFETFLSELFKSQGYEAKPRQILLGSCVPHEVDVVAWNTKEAIMVEAKFHNNHQFKTDLKVALYVKARFDDLKNQEFDYGGKRKLTEGCLITNTKFTSTAIKYATCANLRLIGWNYPRHVGNLQDMVEKAGLHPVTALTSLETREKQELMLKGAVLCRNLGDNPELLGELHIPSKRVDGVLEEIDGLCGLKREVITAL